MESRKSAASAPLRNKPEEQGLIEVTHLGTKFRLSSGRKLDEAVEWALCLWKDMEKRNPAREIMRQFMGDVDFDQFYEGIENYPLLREAVRRWLYPFLPGTDIIVPHYLRRDVKRALGDCEEEGLRLPPSTVSRLLGACDYTDDCMVSRDWKDLWSNLRKDPFNNCRNVWIEGVPFLRIEGPKFCYRGQLVMEETATYCPDCGWIRNTLFFGQINDHKRWLKGDGSFYCFVCGKELKKATREEVKEVAYKGVP